ncbi:MAG: thioredoxin domain-containing protein [Candidatus Thorarchaeota archaeon]
MQKDNKKANRLINEKSPYLLQHSRNPVDWFPWSDEAFDKAKKEDKPIFLSIGYSTCHWCHVMEKESFEDPEVAKLMNDTFISIKVDREERPEIDNLYMTICQMITGSGGWPLTIIMDADKRPFTAGTYFPKNTRFGRIGMMELIPKIKDLWENEREKLKEASNEITEQLQLSQNLNGQILSKEILDEAFNEAVLLFDEVNGGFKGAPKFPTPHKLMFLLRYWNRTKNPQALMIVEKTLQAMRNGGLYDHIGFGFHRYSTDSQWLLPHFEKMLYDQALLAIIYIETYQATKNSFYKEVAEEIFTYVLRDMTSPVGGFYSAEDADSEGEEGLFYTWTIDEINGLLDEDEVEFFIRLFNFDTTGNYLDQTTGEKTGRNIPHKKQSLSEYAKESKSDFQLLVNQLTNIRKKLFTQREKRIHPHKDDKILTDWNGLMIAALAIGGRAFQNQELIDSASKAANFILSNLVTAEGRLLHRYRDKEVAITANIDDYAFFVWGLLELYQSTFNTNYLKSAIEINKKLIVHFWDQKNGGLFFTPDDGEELLIRKKEIYDGAIPSGNSISMLNFIKISRITADVLLEEQASEISKIFGLIIDQALLAHSMLLCGLEYVYGSAFEIVIVGQPDTTDTNTMLYTINNEFIPNKVLMFYPLDSSKTNIERLTEFVKFKESINNKATAHICINRFCKFPTEDISKMLELLLITEKTEM